MFQRNTPQKTLDSWKQIAAYLERSERTVGRYAYDCWNEPHIEPAWERNIWATPQELLYRYCSQTIIAFRSWLQSRYSTLDRLNEAWTRRYPNWESILRVRWVPILTGWIGDAPLSNAVRVSLYFVLRTFMPWRNLRFSRTMPLIIRHSTRSLWAV
jgi:hypothetical protein